MNRTYRLKWNEACRTWIPVGENARTRGSRAGARALRRLGAIGAALVVLPSAAQTTAPDALPTGFNVILGSGSDSRSGNVYTVTQQGQRGVFGFDTFNIGSAATVNVKQDAGAAAMLVVRNDPSYIYGKFNADSTVFLVNPNGMFFGNGASINVGGLLATTMSMDGDEFMKGRYRLTNPGSGTIRNEAIINATGSVALVGNTVENAGEIYATTVTLAAGNNVAIDLTGDGLIRARVEDPALKASIVNSGTINAVAAVALTAGQARDTLDRVVNNTGTIRATGLVERGGEILLEGGLVSNSGTLDASSATGAGGRVDVLGRDVTLAADSVIDVSGATSGGTAYVLGDMQAGRVDVDGRIRARGGSGNGGFIETSAAEVGIADSFRVDALSRQGRAGKWLIDPEDFYINAGSAGQTNSGIGATTLAANLAGADVTIQTVNGGMVDEHGDIYVNSEVSWTANTVLTLSAKRHIQINANIKATGNTAGLRLFYGSTDGTAAPAGGSKYSLNNGASIMLSGSNPLLWIGNRQYTVINSLAALQAMNSDLSGYYALGSDVNASATATWNSGAGFVPIGNASSKFSGVFDGLGHKISNLTINRTAVTDEYVGLFGYNAGRLLNVELAGGAITGYYWVGALAGWNEGYIGNTSSSANVVGSRYVGGLVGTNAGWAVDSAVIERSYATGSVTSSSTGNGGSMGGLVGQNGDWNAGYGYISESYATGNVKYSGGASYWALGGLSGTNYGAISDSYATGAVANYSVSGWVGGFVGLNSPNNASWGGSIAGSWSAGGAIYGGMSFGLNVGPFVGENTGTITDSYWDKSLNCCGVNGYGTNSGTITNLTGLTTSQFLDPTNLANLGFSGGLNNSAKWWMAAGQSRPFLRSEWATYVSNAHQLQLMSLDASANYVLNTDIDLASVLKPANLLIPSGGGNYVEAGSMWGGWTGWTAGTVTSASFASIGNAAGNFTGSFDGQGHTISNLFISSGADYVGLFDKNYGQISDVVLSGASVVGHDYVGLLAGANYGTIVDGHVSGTVVGNSYVGGLVGLNEGGTITRSHSDGDVTASTDYAGGLVGYNDGSTGDAGDIADSYATGVVSGRHRIGGLVGYNYSAVISGSHASATVWGSGTDVGGLVGRNTGSASDAGIISGSYSLGGVGVGGGGSRAGGLVGYNERYGRISDSYSSSLIVSDGQHVGGLAGQNDGLVERSYASGSVTGRTNVGGLVGYNGGISESVYGLIADSYSTASVEASDGEGVAGGLVGRNQGAIIRSYAAAEIVSATVSGGLVGKNISSENSPAAAENSFWLNDPTSGICEANPGCSGVGEGDSSGATGLSEAGFKSLDTFLAVGWDIDDAGGTGKTWRIYDGYTRPLLRALLTPVTVTADNISKTYDGTPYTGDMANDTYSPANAPGSEKIRNFSDPYDSPSDVGEYLPKLYSQQNGYDISYVNAKLTISSSSSGGDVTSGGSDSHSSTEERQDTVDETAKVVAVVLAGDVKRDDSRKDGKSLDGVIPGVNPGAENPVAPKPADEAVAPPPKAKGRMLVCRKG